MIPQDGTIAAIATPIGEGGISVIRISGAQSIEITERCFKGKELLKECATHTAHFGKIINHDHKVIDQVVTTIFRSPKSYTGEDTIEISCHGGIFVTNAILEEIIKNGARLAEPGEFTKRAFLNGKMDLSQAEAVADLIHARTQASHQASMNQLQGRLSEEIVLLRQKLINIISLIELELDFSEEGIGLIERSRILEQIKEIKSKVREMIQSYTLGKIYKHGVRVVIAGRPNVGKSSILNRLLKTNRAIVTDIPGTTRDTIEESIIINNVLFTFVDTAGLRDSSDIIEIEGINRAKQEIKSADIILLILDLTAEYLQDDDYIFSTVLNSNIPFIVVLNKFDILENRGVNTFPSEIEKSTKFIVSAKNGYGIKLLMNRLFSIALDGANGFMEKNVVIINSRHLSSLKKAESSLFTSIKNLNSSFSGEFISLDLRTTRTFLGEILGEINQDDILNNIFSKFCIGK